MFEECFFFVFFELNLVGEDVVGVVLDMLFDFVVNWVIVVVCGVGLFL